MANVHQYASLCFFFKISKAVPHVLASDYLHDFFIHKCQHSSHVLNILVALLALNQYLTEHIFF